MMFFMCHKLLWKVELQRIKFVKSILLTDASTFLNLMVITQHFISNITAKVNSINKLHSLIYSISSGALLFYG